MDELSKHENYQHYWDLINTIDKLCHKALSKGTLYADDILSVLDRVKINWLVEHIECRYDLKPPKEE